MPKADVQYYLVKSSITPGSDYRELLKKVRLAYKTIAKQTKRTPYVRSPYFNRDKIFLSLYWSHLSQIPQHAQRRRLQLFNCGIELLRHTTFTPDTRPNPNGRNEIVHCFGGITANGQKFFVNIKQEIRSGKKFFMSVYPAKK